MDNHLHSFFGQNPFEFAFRESAVGMAILQPADTAFYIAAVNPAFAKTTGCNEQDIIGKDIVRFFSAQSGPQDVGADLLAQSLQKVMASRLPDKMPITKYVSKARSKLLRRYFQCENKPCIAADGQIQHIVFAAYDVTERYCANREMRKTWKRLTAGQEIAKVAYWETDLRRNTMFWSDEFYNLLGLKKGEVTSGFEQYLSMIHPEDRPTFLETRKNTIAGNQKMDIEMRIITANGSEKWVRQIGRTNRNRNGVIVSFEGVVMDITDAKHLKLSMEESNRRYRHISKATFDAIYDWNLKEHKYNWGENFHACFGYPNEILTEPNFWIKQVHPEDIDRVRQSNKLALQSSTTNIINEYRFRRHDGSYAYVTDRSFIVRDTQGVPVRMIGAIRDISNRKRLQVLLDKSNRLAKIGSWELDMSTQQLFWSDVTKEIYEVPDDFQPSVANLTDFFATPEARREIIKRISEAYTSGKSWQEDYQIKTQTGKLKWVRNIGDPKMENNECKKIYGSILDIDEQKKAELEINALHEEKKLILESIGDAFFSVDNEWTITYWNKAAEQILKTPKNKTLGEKLWNAFDKKISAHYFQKYKAAFDSKQRVDFEDYYAPLDAWFEVNAFPYTNGLSVFFRDITERKFAQIKLTESEKRYSELFHLNPHPIWIFETETYRFVKVNKATSELYGYSEEEFLQMTVLQMRPTGEIPVLLKALRGNTKGDGFISGVFKHQTKSGKLITVEVESKLMYFNNRKCRLAIITDITERLRIEQKITRAIIKTQENERYEIGAELHDNVCQILASTYVRMNLMNADINESALPLFNSCKESIDLATREIRDLSHRLAPASIYDTTLQATIETLINISGIGQKYTINFKYDKKLNRTKLSKELQLNLYRILQEQLRNIYKYAGCRTIDVKLSKVNRRIVMLIADDGVGFDLAKVKSGIGLSNMKRRTELFDGNFEITTSPGNGCELRIEVPLK